MFLRIKISDKNSSGHLPEAPRDPGGGLRQQVRGRDQAERHLRDARRGLHRKRELLSRHRRPDDQPQAEAEVSPGRLPADR